MSNIKQETKDNLPTFSIVSYVKKTPVLAEFNLEELADAERQLLFGCGSAPAEAKETVVTKRKELTDDIQSHRKLTVEKDALLTACIELCENELSTTPEVTAFVTLFPVIHL